MEEGKKKSIMLAIVVVCLVIAGIALLATREKDFDLGSVRGEVALLMCEDENCGATYEIDMADYFNQLKKRQKETGAIGTPALFCKECGKETIYRAIKCPKCGEIFFRGTVEDDYADRCPKCKYSKIEESAKQRK